MSVARLEAIESLRKIKQICSWKDECSGCSIRDRCGMVSYGSDIYFTTKKISARISISDDISVTSCPILYSEDASNSLDIKRIHSLNKTIDCDNCSSTIAHVLPRDFIVDEFNLSDAKKRKIKCSFSPGRLKPRFSMKISPIRKTDAMKDYFKEYENIPIIFPEKAIIFPESARMDFNFLTFSEAVKIFSEKTEVARIKFNICEKKLILSLKTPTARVDFAIPEI